MMQMGILGESGETTFTSEVLLVGYSFATMKCTLLSRGSTVNMFWNITQKPFVWNKAIRMWDPENAIWYSIICELTEHDIINTLLYTLR